MTQELARRLATIVALVERSAGKSLGRTAVMKLLYFLSTLRGVQLGYRFTLYSYGPFDSEVLQDLDYATNLGALTSKVVAHPGGYGYLIEPGPTANAAMSFDATFVASRQEDLAWVLNEFGRLGAADLELASTIIYIDRQSSVQDIDGLASSVNAVKPHFSVDRIRDRIQTFSERGWLQSIH
jgi:uncharacterized protein YwgA